MPGRPFVTVCNNLAPVSQCSGPLRCCVVSRTAMRGQGSYCPAGRASIGCRAAVCRKVAAKLASFLPARMPVCFLLATCP